MKIKNYFLIISLVLLSSASTHFFTSRITTSAQTASVAQPALINEYQVGSVLYMQTAGEYRALAFQAFNLARWQLDGDFDKKNLKNLSKAERKKPRAVIVDIDETILDNSPQEVNLIKQNLAFDPQIFTAWVKKEMAKPIPGAVDFLNYAHQKGVKVFYVTNRNAAEKSSTINNLNALKFPDATDETVQVHAPETFSKEPRRLAIKDNYRIVLLMGDNLNDFSDVFENKSVSDRFIETDKARELFGKKFIVLPNAIYGDWESAVYGYPKHNEIDEAGKRAKRYATLQGF